jgi:hypothetical protein
VILEQPAVQPDTRMAEEGVDAVETRIDDAA